MCDYVRFVIALSLVPNLFIPNFFLYKNLGRFILLCLLNKNHYSLYHSKPHHSQDGPDCIPTILSLILSISLSWCLSIGARTTKSICTLAFSHRIYTLPLKAFMGILNLSNYPHRAHMWHASAPKSYTTLEKQSTYLTLQNHSHRNRMYSSWHIIPIWTSVSLLWAHRFPIPPRVHHQ